MMQVTVTDIVPSGRDQTRRVHAVAVHLREACDWAGLIVLVSYGCCNECSHTQWLKQHTCVLS